MRNYFKFLHIFIFFLLTSCGPEDCPMGEDIYTAWQGISGSRDNLIYTKGQCNTKAELHLGSYGSIWLSKITSVSSGTGTVSAYFSTDCKEESKIIIGLGYQGYFENFPASNGFKSVTKNLPKSPDGKERIGYVIAAQSMEPCVVTVNNVYTNPVK